MADSLKEIINRLKLQNSQKSNPAPVKAEIPQETEELDEDEEIDTEQEKVAVKPQKSIAEASPSKDEIKEQKLLEEIEMLQNNGRYRAELLYQLQEINRALVVIAGVLVDLSGNGKDTK